MDEDTLIIVHHKNSFSTYLSDWRMMMGHVVKHVNPEVVQRYNLTRIPTPFESLSNNTYDLSVVLYYLDSRLTILEEKPIPQLDLKAYAEARVFLKAFYVFFRIVLDDISGVIEYFYKINEPKVAVTKSFDDLLKNAKEGKLPPDLSTILESSSSWFPEVKDSRDDFIHHYDSHLISIKEVKGGKTILGHFNVGGRTHRKYQNIREHLGFFLCEYQTMVDNLIDHFDAKFEGWHRITMSKSLRNITIMQGCVAFPMWWAYKYGSYRHKDLYINKGD